MPLCDRHLAVSRLISEKGEVSDKLPEWLNPSLAQKITADYQHQILEDYSIDHFLPGIIVSIERLTWLQGVDDMARNLKDFVARLKKLSADYSRIPSTSPEQYDLQRKYEAARRIKVRERIKGGNEDDIMAFRSSLLHYSIDLCEALLYRQLSRLYADIAASPELNGLITRLEATHSQAQHEIDSLVIADHPSEWDAEYSRLVPVDFFERNIEDIDAAMAFQMVLLQTFARNENTLRSQRFITPAGRISIFSTPYQPLVHTLIPLILQ